METDSVLHIHMLGECTLSYQDKTLDEQTLRSKKIWTLLEYLITFRNKSISQNELIELIYPEEKSDNPGNALKTLLHRTRCALEELGFSNGKATIIQRRGSYLWNPELDLDVDVDHFEALCSQAESTEDPEARLGCYMEAAALYKGDFLPKSALEPWVVPINTYYHTLYLRIVHDAVALLAQRQQNSDIVHLCQKAIGIDPYDEFLYYHLIQALIDMKRPQAAMIQYENMTRLFYSEFGVTPSKELQALYKELVKTSNSVETDLSIIKESLREKDEKAGAFYCEYEFFKDIYQLEVRSAARSGATVHLCLLTVSVPSGSMPPVKSLNNAMEKLSACIRGSLRRGDVYTRYSVCQFMILLPMTTYENGEMVLDRIKRRFRRENPRSTLLLNTDLQAIDSSL